MAALDTLTEQIDHRIKVTSSRLGTSRADVRDVLETLRGELRAGFEMWKLQTESDYLRRHTEILFRLCSYWGSSIHPCSKPIELTHMGWRWWRSSVL